MNLILKGQIGEYRVCSLLKMFFPTEKFFITDLAEEDFIILRIKQGRKSSMLLAVVSLCAHVYRSHEAVSLDLNNEIKQERLCAILYRILCKAQGVDLPWGMLTGVRPIKRIRNMIEQEDIPRELIHDELNKRFFVSREKSELCLLTYEVQGAMCLKTSPKAYSLYVSIPFCPTRCSYCSFVSHAVSTQGVWKLMDKYIELLCEELELTSKIAEKLGLILQSVYIGGGTPTVLNNIQMEKVLNAVENNFDISNCDEYTVEAGRPDTITTKKLRLLYSKGVRRISINPQSFNDDVLKEIGREHSAKLVVDCYYAAREAGFDWINMDIIAGLPGDTINSFQHTIRKAVKLSPENITVHALTLKRASRLHEEMREDLGGYAARMISFGSGFLIKNGYQPYYLYRQKNMVDNLENVGYSKKGFESPYNVYIMEENQNILATGAGAVSKLVFDRKIQRIFNYKYPGEYIKGFAEMLNRKKKVVKFFEDNN